MAGKLTSRSRSQDRVAVERRKRPRTTREHRATTFIQALLENPDDAIEMLDDDLAAGGDSAVLFGVIDAAEASLRLRGIQDLSAIRSLRAHLQRRVERG